MPARSLTTESHRLHLRLSLSFLDSVSATMLSLDLMYDTSIQVFLSLQKFRIFLTVLKINLFLLLIAVITVVLPMVIFIKVLFRFLQYVLREKYAA